MRKDVLKQIERIHAMGIKINYSELARQMDCDPRTVKNYSIGKTKLIRNPRKEASVLDDYLSIIEDKVDNCSATAMSIYKYIEQKGYTGKYGLVKKYVRNYKQTQRKKATIRFETNPGLQAQVDYKERKKMINKHGEIIEINIFLYVLGYSRTKYLKLTTDRTQATLFNCLIQAFNTTGGIPQEILFDNMATVVDRHHTHMGHVQFNKKFNQFAKDFNFTPIACKPYRAQTKGKVEALAKLTNRLDVYNHEFETMEELQKIVNQISIELNNEISQAINVTPLTRLTKEREYLLPMPAKSIRESYTMTNKKYKVSKESMITYLGNKYSVPTAYIGTMVEVETLFEENQLNIRCNNDLIVTHHISTKLLNYKKEHAVEILQSDAFKYKSLKEIEEVIENNLQHMDILLV